LCWRGVGGGDSRQALCVSSAASCSQANCHRSRCARDVLDGTTRMKESSVSPSSRPDPPPSSRSLHRDGGALVKDGHAPRARAQRQARRKQTGSGLLLLRVAQARPRRTSSSGSSGASPPLRPPVPNSTRRRRLLRLLPLHRRWALCVLFLASRARSCTPTSRPLA
jgi:hypothetical protein